MRTTAKFAKSPSRAAEPSVRKWFNQSFLIGVYVAGRNILRYLLFPSLTSIGTRIDGVLTAELIMKYIIILMYYGN